MLSSQRQLLLKTVVESFHSLESHSPGFSEVFLTLLDARHVALLLGRGLRFQQAAEPLLQLLRQARGFNIILVLNNKFGIAGCHRDVPVQEEEQSRNDECVGLHSVEGRNVAGKLSWKCSSRQLGNTGEPANSGMNLICTLGILERVEGVLLFRSFQLIGYMRGLRRHY